MLFLDVADNEYMHEKRLLYEAYTFFFDVYEGCMKHIYILIELHPALKIILIL